MLEGFEPREFKDFIMGWEEKQLKHDKTRDYMELKLVCGSEVHEKAVKLNSKELQ